MVNKKGFLRILEAIVAIVIILGFVVSIIPEKQKNTSQIPPDLDQTINSVLKKIQDTPEFRFCISNGSIDYSMVGKLIGANIAAHPKPVTDAECVRSYIRYLSFPVEIHPWEYAVKVCKINATEEFHSCRYDPGDDGFEKKSWEEKEFLFADTKLPKDKDVYIKSVTVTVPDVTTKDQKNSQAGNYSIVTVYAWARE